MANTWSRTRSDTEGIRTLAGRAQWISSPSPKPLGHSVLAWMAKASRCRVYTGSGHCQKTRGDGCEDRFVWSRATENMQKAPMGDGTQDLQLTRLKLDRRAISRHGHTSQWRACQDARSRRQLRPKSIEVEGLIAHNGQQRQRPYRLVVRTSRCGRGNPGSTPGEDTAA